MVACHNRCPQGADQRSAGGKHGKLHVVWNHNIRHMMIHDPICIDDNKGQDLFARKHAEHTAPKVAARA